MPQQRYVAALGYRILDRLYDPFLRWTMPERAFKRELLRQAGIQPRTRVLDLGCGTGTLMLMAADVQPSVILVGLDGDAAILHIAQEKATRARRRLILIVGVGQQLPVRSNSFDCVLTSLVLHHLSHDNKRLALCEAYRVLRAGGELHIADWGRPHTRAMRIASVLLRSFELPEATTDNLAGRIPHLCEEAGFRNVAETERFRTMFGTLSLYKGKKVGYETDGQRDFAGGGRDGGCEGGR
jgi:SAM-dependent methyltransferase